MAGPVTRLRLRVAPAVLRSLVSGTAAREAIFEPAGVSPVEIDCRPDAAGRKEP